MFLRLVSRLSGLFLVLSQESFIRSDVQSALFRKGGRVPRPQEQNVVVDGNECSLPSPRQKEEEEAKGRHHSGRSGEC